MTNDEEVGRYLERAATRRLARTIERASNHADHARLLATLARETNGDVKAEGARHIARRAEHHPT